MSTISTSYASSYNDMGVVFTDKTDNLEMDYQSFLNLMILELQNQDFLSENDNSDLLDQMATISNMQLMEQMNYQSETTYAANLVGKVVTASRFTVSGDLDSTTGVVDKVSIYDGEYIIYIGGKTYTLDQIMEIGASSSEAGTLQTEDYEIYISDLSSDSVTLKWLEATEDVIQSAGLKYSVYYSEDSDFDTVEDVEAGTLVGEAEQSGFYTTYITDLEPDTKYYANVVVTDANGNKTIYAKAEFTTFL